MFTIGSIQRRNRQSPVPAPRSRPLFRDRGRPGLLAPSTISVKNHINAGLSRPSHHLFISVTLRYTQAGGALLTDGIQLRGRESNPLLNGL